MVAPAQSTVNVILVLFLASSLTSIDALTFTATRLAVAFAVSRPTTLIGITPSLRPFNSALRMVDDAGHWASGDVPNEEPMQMQGWGEDLEVTRLKEELAYLESTLKSKRDDLDSVINLAEKYTENGYRRSVAELQSVRARRNNAFANNAFSAKAGIIETFVPVLDELIYIASKYQGNEFAQKFSALRGNFYTALKELGVTEYNIEVGAEVDLARMMVVGEEYSDVYAKGTVVRPIMTGIELEGNVIRPAECVASLGREAPGEGSVYPGEEDLFFF